MVKNNAWYVRGVPWKECPFRLQLVILAADDVGKEGVEEFFKAFYKNEGITIEECEVVNVVTGPGCQEEKEEIEKAAHA